MNFKQFPKIKRLDREIIVTEKIDGTNASVFIGNKAQDVLNDEWDEDFATKNSVFCDSDLNYILAGSRTRWITPNDDNYGFAKWCSENAFELLRLGHGHHFGEWWGKGVNRNYGLSERRFSLFNTSKWSDENLRPKCCDVVPVLASLSKFDSSIIEFVMSELGETGSKASLGFMKPEGIVVFHTHANICFKKTFEGDQHKG